MDFSVKTRDVKMGTLPFPRLPGWDYDGKLTVQANMKGDMKSPEISGNLILREGTLSSKKPPLTYENVSAAIQLLPGKIVIEKLSVAGDKEGRLECTGNVLLSDWKPKTFRLALNGDNFFVPFHSAVTARINPDISLTGDLDAPRLNGTVTILESRVNLDRLAQKGPGEIQIVEQSDKTDTLELSDREAKGTDFLKPLTADLNLIVPKNAWLKGQGLDAEIDGQVNVKKAPQKSFVLIGTLNTIRGNFGFQGKVFKFKKGSVSFLGLDEPDPSLDIQAVTRVRKINIVIQITGTARAIRLAFSSEPDMDQADILSYLAFGKPTSELKDQQAAGVEQAALGMIGQVAASELRDIFGGSSFVDTISIDSGGGDLSNGSVTVGKYVSPDVFVTYKQGLGDNVSSEVDVAYEINKNLSVETQLGDEKTTGIDFFWEFDF
jgi:translocation and assembly module TamB